MKERSATLGTVQATLVALLCCISAYGQAPPPIDAETLLKLDGREFFKSADEASFRISLSDSPYSGRELIAISSKLVGSLRSPAKGTAIEEPIGYAFYQFFKAACRHANADDLDELIAIYRRIDPDGFEKSAMLPYLAARVLEREVAALRTEGRRVSLPRGSAAIPAGLDTAPKELHAAHQLYQLARAPFEAAFSEPKEVVEVTANERSFYELVDAAISGATGREDEVRQFAWLGANCLNVTDVEDAQDIAVLLMLLRERRIDEAIGVALRVVSTDGATSAPEALAGAVISLFDTIGLDWEMIFAGAQIARELSGRGFEKKPLVTALVKNGTERAVPLVFGLTRLAKAESRSRYIRLLGSWIQTTDGVRKCGDKSVELGRYAEKRPGKPMPTAVQIAAIHLTEELTAADSPEELAQSAINIFGRTQRASSVPALQALAGHNSRQVATDALYILCAMGLETIPDLKPARFRILANGKPLPVGNIVIWTVSAGSTTESGPEKILPDGILEVQSSELPAFEGLGEFRLSSSGASPEDVTFEVSAPMPPPDGQIIEVNVAVRPLEIVLRGDDKLNGPPPDKVWLLLRPHRDDGDGGRGRVFEEGDEIAAAKPIVLPKVQDGTYDVAVGATGAEVWSGRVTVGPSSRPVEVQLKPASDLRYEIVFPGGRRSRRGGGFYRDGEEIPLSPARGTDTYRSVPCGTYRLHILGSDSVETIRETKVKRGPDEIPYSGRDILFEIKPGSPSVVDLGEIHLKPSGH